MPEHDSSMKVKLNLMLGRSWCGVCQQGRECLRFTVPFCQGANVICLRAQDLPHAYTVYCAFDLLGLMSEMRVTGGESVNVYSWSENAPRVGGREVHRLEGSGELNRTSELNPASPNPSPCYLLLCSTKLLILGLCLLVCNPLSWLSKNTVAFASSVWNQVVVLKSACESSCFDRCSNQGLE